MPTNVIGLAATDSQLLGAIVLSIAVVALGLLVALHNPRAAVNQRFCVMALTTAGWIITISLAVAVNDLQGTVTLGRIGFAFASGIPFSMVWMVDAVSVFRGRRQTLLVLIPGTLCLIFVLASTSPLIIARAVPGHPRVDLVYGPFHRFFGVYFLLSFASGLYTLWKSTTAASGINRLQLRYLLLGIALTGAGAMTTNLLIPLIWHTARYSALGPYFSLLFFSFSAHAIIRHRLMDVRFVIRNGVVYVCSILISATLFFLVAEALRRLAGYDKNRVPLLQALVAAILLAIFFQPLKGWVQRALNRYVYRETYNYQRTVRGASRRLSSMLDLDPLLQYLTDVIENTFKVEAVTVYLRPPSSKAFKANIPSRRDKWQQASSHIEIPDTSPLVMCLRSTPTTLVREEARDSSDQHLSAAAQALRELGGDIAFPLTGDQGLAGLLIVGTKRSGDPYFAEDIDLLETLISQAAVAMKNAQLYRQVVLVNEYLDNILSTMESGVIALNAIGEISLFNSAAERLTGLQASAVLGSPFTFLPSSLASPLRDVLDANTARSEFEVSVWHPERASVPLVCSTAILKHRGGAIDGALIVFSDLTRLKDLEREKRRAERLASFGALASGVAHEIKNPLVAIRTFAELLPERFNDTDFREDFAKVVIREIARIDDLVGRLRGIAATAPQKVGAVDVRQPITETLRLLRAQLEQTRTTVHCEFNDQSPCVAVEEAQLKQLFLNLCLNAIEAMGTGGALLIHVYRRDLHGTGWVVVAISDTGPGIPESVKTNIFDPFFTTKPRGSGLGLAICRGIVDAHRGTIRAENRPDQSGTTIVVELPASSDSPVLTEEHVFGA